MIFMAMDGALMLHILERFADAKKPALGIHDSLVVRRSDLEFAYRTIWRVYQLCFQFPPVIKRVF